VARTQVLSNHQDGSGKQVYPAKKSYSKFQSQRINKILISRLFAQTLTPLEKKKKSISWLKDPSSE